jgi:hypothetical protein
MEEAVKALRNAMATLALKPDCATRATADKFKRLLHESVLLLWCEQNSATTGCFQMLPPEILAMICGHLRTTEVVALASTCHELRSICTSDAVWSQFTPKIAQPLIPRPPHKSHYWYYLAHRVYTPPSHGIVLISPCTVVTESLTYTGDFVDGYYEGWGHRDSPACVYTGEWYLGIWHGSGKLALKISDEKYEGGFAYGYYHGRGAWQKDEETYTGTFYYGKFMHGEWTENGAQCSGQCRAPPQEKTVKRIWKSTIAECTYVDGKCHGIKLLTCPRGTSESLFIDGRMAFIIKSDYPDIHAQGHAKDGKAHGLFRTMHKDCGDCEIGRYDTGNKQGWWLLKRKNGTRCLYKWKDGKCKKESKIELD